MLYGSAGVESARQRGWSVFRVAGTTSAGGWCRSGSRIRRWWRRRRFGRCRGMRAARRTLDGQTRSYVFAGQVVCGLCGRRLDSHWVNGRAGYRCRHGHSSAKRRHVGLAKNVYVREDRLLSELLARVPDLADVDGGAIVRYLRTNRLVITYSDESWTLDDVADTAITLEPGTQLTLMLG